MIENENGYRPECDNPKEGPFGHLLDSDGYYRGTDKERDELIAALQDFVDDSEKMVAEAKLTYLLNALPAFDFDSEPTDTLS